MFLFAGPPAFQVNPADALEVNENEVLNVNIMFTGNPKPIAEFKWAHSSDLASPDVHIQYPFVYRATYSSQQVSKDYCGKQLKIRLKNSEESLEKTIEKTTTVIILRMFYRFSLLHRTFL